VPTFRVHLPDNLAVGEFHTDGAYHHQQGEINFWLPVTEAFDTNSLWIESEPGRADFSPVRLTPGQVYMFDGVNLSHGNKVNRTGVTRVSFDFRLISRHRFTNTDHVSVSAGRRMSIGHYWSALAGDTR
jgi:ectoine hydroxylase-related dioxygenase (phytanoyl-CoA dioxygenase family)